MRELVGILRKQNAHDGFAEEQSESGVQAIGRTVTVNALNQGSPSPIELIRATFEKPRACCIKMQCLNQTSSAGSTLGVQVNILEATYGARFNRAPFNLKVGPAQTLRMFARTVSVTVQAPATPENTFAATVSGLLTYEPQDSLGELFEVWVPWVQTSGSVQQVSPSGTYGYLLGGEGYLLTLGGTDAGPYFVQWHDAVQGSTLSSGTSVPLYEIGPVTVNGEFSFAHDTRPDLVFATGLCAVLSTTPRVYTAVGAGASARVDTSVGY